MRRLGVSMRICMLKAFRAATQIVCGVWLWPYWCAGEKKYGRGVEVTFKNSDSGEWAVRADCALSNTSTEGDRVRKESMDLWLGVVVRAKTLQGERTVSRMLIECNKDLMEQNVLTLCAIGWTSYTKKEEEKCNAEEQ
ncbi:hypothetical protein Tco_1477047 [Tanacetum coccineum]